MYALRVRTCSLMFLDSRLLKIAHRFYPFLSRIRRTIALRRDFVITSGQIRSLSGHTSRRHVQFQACGRAEHGEPEDPRLAQCFRWDSRQLGTEMALWQCETEQRPPPTSPCGRPEVHIYSLYLPGSLCNHFVRIHSEVQISPSIARCTLERRSFPSRALEICGVCDVLRMVPEPHSFSPAPRAPSSA